MLEVLRRLPDDPGTSVGVWHLLRYTIRLWYAYFGSVDALGDRFCDVPIEDAFRRSCGRRWRYAAGEIVSRPLAAAKYLRVEIAPPPG
jgi:hypothetical protein